MPRLNVDEIMESTALPTGSYGYSAVGIENLGASEYTLVTIVQDVSGSVSSFKKEMEDCLKEVIGACKKSARADNLMIRLTAFDNDLEEIHGFKLLEDCNLDDYTDVLTIRGMTALYDASENAISAISNYGKTLVVNDYSVNGIVIVITDGCDNASAITKQGVKAALSNVLREESLESLVTILVGVGTKDYAGVADSLKEYKDEAGLTQFIDIEDADAKTLAKLAEFVSQSISSQSQALGTGGPSQPISLSF